MKKNRLYASVFAVLVGIYVLITVFTPLDPAVSTKYGLSHLKLRILILTITVPLIAIWAVAFYGFIRLRQYATLIYDRTDGKALHKISRGLEWLAYGLPAFSIVSNITNYQARMHPGFKPVSVITQNYLNLIIYFVSFAFISRGASMLVQYVKKKPNYGEQHVWVIIHTVLAVFYTFLILDHPIYTNGLKEIYYLPNWLLLTTIAIPYLLLWHLGLRSAYKLNFYRRTITGELYRQALSALSQGVLFIILSSISIQIITTLSARVDRLSLAPLLIFIYTLLIFISLGYFFVALGANRMKKLEEV